MKSYLLLSILLFPALTSFQMNATDSWQIYYNKEMIQEFKEAKKENLLHIKAQLVKNLDSISIRYSNETVCATCRYELKIPMEAGGIYFIEVPTPSKQISLSLKQLLAFHKDNNWKPLPIMFVISNRANPDKELPICSIQFE